MHTSLLSVIVAVVAIVQTCCCVEQSSVYSCGIPGLLVETRVWHGWDADSTDWPWHSAIFLRETDAYDYICGGTLIDHKFVVTAAHCLVNEETGEKTNSNLLAVHFGRQYLNVSSKRVQERQVKDVIIHPLYWHESVNNDIALLSLKKEVQFNEYVQPVCLKRPSQVDFKSYDLEGKNGRIVGFGKTESGTVSMTLQTASLPVIDRIECLESDRDLYSQVISYGMFCAGYQNGTSVCTGDSGGGMFFRENDKWVLRGIVSFSGVKEDTISCDYEKYAGFINVQKYVSWIRTIIDDRTPMVTGANKMGISIIGSKYIRPNRPYSVAFVNPLKDIVKLNLSLECNDSKNFAFKKESMLRLSSTSGKNVQFPVPNITPTSNCTFSAINDGGKVFVNHDVSLAIPDKTLSIFIQTDKPVYKPGDKLRFRVVVVDIETKPVTNIKSIEVLIEDKYKKSVRHWPFAKLNEGIFETSYQISALSKLGTWTITVTVYDSSFLNKKTQIIEVKEYVLPKFTVKVWPTKTLLIEERNISLNVDSHYTFGDRVEGKVRVHLYLDKYSKKASHEAVQGIHGRTVVLFQLQDELKVNAEEDYTLVNMTVAVTDWTTNATVNITQLIPVYLKPYKISLIKPSLYYRPGVQYHFKLSVKDHTGLPAEQGKMIKAFIDGEEKSAPLGVQGLASFVIETPDEVDSIAISAEFDSVQYGDIGFIEGLESSSTQYLQINSNERFKLSENCSFIVSSNEPIAQLTYFIMTRGSIVYFDYIKSRKKKFFTLKLKLTEAMAPKATLVVFIIKDGRFIFDKLDIVFESFSNDFQFRLNKVEKKPYRPNEEIFVEGTAQEDSVLFFHAIDQSALLLDHTEYGLTKQRVLDDLDQYTGNGRDNTSEDWFDSMGLFFKSDSVFKYSGSRAKRSLFLGLNDQRMAQKSIQQRSDFPEAWLWRNTNMDIGDFFEIRDSVPDTITSWYVTGFALSPTRGLGIMNYPRKFTVDKPFFMIANLPYSIQRGEVAPIQVTLYNFLGNRVYTNVTLLNNKGEIEFVDKSSTDDDLIGIPDKHLESLLNIPNGSGDLNLLKLIPNIVALDYLTSADSDIDEKVKQKAIDSLKKGYVNQLKYRSSGGAFRQWISETDKESIFLTALMANTLQMASKYITVDPIVIKEAFSWLASKQKSDGCFNEIGDVVYSPIQESSSSVPLTAFVVAAIKENSNISSEYETLVNKAVECLANRFYYPSSNYHKALATYALSLANHPKRDQFLDKLIETSISDEDGLYWDEGSLSVEIAGYALLSYIAQDNPVHGLVFIYKWLKRQTYSSGELAENQRTFVGLKAMSKLAQILSPSHNDYKVQISSPPPREWKIDIDINRETAPSFIELELPNTLRHFRIEFSGTGYGFFRLSYQYRFNIAVAKPSFNLNIELLQTSNQEVQDLKVCLNYGLFEDSERSNKALVEIHLPSGFTANDNAVRDLSPDREIKNTMRVYNGSGMYVYYNSVGTRSVCFVVTAHRQSKIAMHRLGYVFVYDTQKRDRFALRTFEEKWLQPCDICEDEDCTSQKC